MPVLIHFCCEITSFCFYDWLYWQAIDWRALEEKRVTPPFKPAVNGLLDTKVNE